ncbi:MAG: hypothetical protein HN948_08760 [Clostridia bacterium]|mgnify:CR=1 FL=1|jgi:hypothetical protein|nr:hypothetical protein [Clostridia bacterium]MBT7123080.1 hypothetical protein [Clostridia bacterium]
MILVDYLKQNGLNVSILSKLTKIPYATLHKGIEQRGVLKAENLAKVANQLGLTMDEVFAMLDRGHPCSTLTNTLLSERDSGAQSGIYRYTQVHFAYGSGSIDGASLTPEQTAAIFDANDTGGASSVRDITATANTMYVFDVMLGEVQTMLSESLLLSFAQMLTNATGRGGAFADTRRMWHAAKEQISRLLLWYNALPSVSFSDILQFHATFIRINPIGSASGALARVITFKECLRAQQTPFIIHEDYKAFYLRGVEKFDEDSTFLSDVCLTMQESYQNTIKQFLGEEYLQKLIG